MARYCDGCGKLLEEGKIFCDHCGRKAQPIQVKPPVAYAPPAKKSRSGLFLGLGLGAVVAFVVFLVLGGGTLAVILISRGGNTPAPTAAATKGPSLSSAELAPFPDELKVGDVKVNCQYKSPEYIIPANYRSLDYVVFLQCWTDRGHTSVMVTVEIPEFTQKYEQMLDISRAETELSIRPPLLESAAKSLNSSRDAQVVVTVKDMTSGQIVLQDTRPIKLYSFYDMKWEDENGIPYYENILAWVTPEAPEILKMNRDSCDSLKTLTGGQMDAIVGYQQAVSGWSPAQITAAQVCAMMYTLAAKYDVQYTNTAFSSTGSALQRIATPANVINNHAGLCIETAATMASAIQASTMHAVIILLPGHAQVAVETWNGSGEYLLIETTALDQAREQKFEYVIQEMSQQEWKNYLSQPGYVAIDCALAEQLHITPIG